MPLTVSYYPPAKRNYDWLDEQSFRLWSALSRLRKWAYRPATSLLLACLMTSSIGQFGISQASSSENVEPPVLLTSDEKRVVIGQLYELTAMRVQLLEVKSIQKEALAEYEQEKTLWLERIAMEKQAYELSQARIASVERERDLALEKATFYQTSLDVCQKAKKTGFWCRVKKVVTIGLARCK